MALIIDGKTAGADIIANVTNAVLKLEASHQRKPGLAVVIVGDDPASHAYVAAKSRMAKKCGFHSVQHTLPANITQSELLSLIARLNSDPEIDGILVQLPLPKHLNGEKVIQAVLPEKDVDGLHVVNAGKVATGDLTTGLVPCTPAGTMLLIQQIHGSDLSGLNALVIGRSNLFGRPMAQLLLNANATVMIAHSKSRNLPSLARQVDILVAAVGRPQMVRADWVKPGATVIDVGINRVAAPEKGEGKTKLVGDVDFEEVAAVAGAVTPVPGGVGPMTIAMLMANTLNAARPKGCA
ncbi:bifunctional methylenetetrahydrofolate dehydrogenase/methenyltetrahydrofolate cyclohydrolase [Agrobacterium salinitolerans]|uniref:bifunctional methylenetetrahydrofolate dehydrogenase/methenyltetrahydrofolate cyclohydrolase FolD n=1 Tax=Agrobacterium salinitolerans TaxID=1183413 RepID=UPI00098FB00F|nr:bifunctional methylenetetrahydrofolate dehydrogenase/methenyltetrahydrofolate cyclohydrolase FolD [Agrobacterium salinitolerans]OOO27734.1 bifunctional methylenetetrahydrofolate dehydrogenase/methenyltetrahydrofolate cyclohydrolase [Agrobacterium salinitolerans]PNQ25637.1 bifunctional methylenetetrahydrofolate dehydrogenase/methenyltetrahydrofolate cyclohydrolase FolD [Rhizobium sp. YIC5082]